MKTKKTPLRMCLACKEMKPKEELLRIVRQKDGACTLNPKAMGRGAYICKKDECVQLCMKKRLLNRAYKINIAEDVYNSLLEEYAGRKQD